VVYTPLTPLSSTSAFGYTSDEAHNLAPGKAPLLTVPAAQHERQMLQVVFAQSAELSVKAIHVSYLRLICSFLDELLAVLALCALLQTLHVLLKGYSFDFMLRLSNEDNLYNL